MQVYESIRQQNVTDYGTKVDNWIPIIINQYSDRTHFIYEVLQNAEDADATEIEFKLFSDRIEIYHNGRPFNQKDIKGVSGIAAGTKEDGTRIGHFGIGFKAVYGYTQTPQIYSGEYHFEIRDFINPYDIKAKDDLDKNITCLILPFNKTLVPNNIAYSEIKEALTEKIKAESILMLNHISEVRIGIDDYKSDIIISKEKKALDDNNNVFALNVMTLHGSDESHDDYLLFTDDEKEATIVVFKVDYDAKELLEVKNSKIYAYFPTAKEAHQKFYIHAPFDTTPARDNFKEGADFGRHNIELVNRIGELIHFSFNWLRDNRFLSFSGFNKVFPIYEYEKTDILRGIYEKSIEIIKSGEKLIPTNTDGVYKSIKEVCVPENMGIVSVFPDSDLQRLFENKKIYWISKEITTTGYSELKKFFDINFELKTYEWRHLVIKMDADFLRAKDVEWFEKLTASIESFCIKRVGNTHYIDVSSIPLVRLKEGEQIVARANGKPQVYLNNPDICKNHINDEFLKNEDIRSFYERVLQISNYDIESVIIEKILPKYENKELLEKNHLDITENIKDLENIKSVIGNNLNILEKVRDSFILSDGNGWYKPIDLYIKSAGEEGRNGYSLLDGKIELRFLSDDYDKSFVLDEDFFRKIGCSKGLKVKKVDEAEYRNTIVKYIGIDEWKNNYTKVMFKKYVSTGFDWSFCYEYMPMMFENITEKKSIALARFFNNHCSDFAIKGEISGAGDKHFSGKDFDSIIAYSVIGLYICFEKWIYVKGVGGPQRPIDVDIDDLLDIYQPYKRLLRMIPFKEVKSELYKYLETVYDNKGDIELIRTIMSDPDELLSLAKAKVKSDAKRAAIDEKRGSLTEQLEKADRKQKEKQKYDEIPDVSPISEKGLERRSEKLEESFKESLDYRTSVTKGVHLTSGTCNKEERSFLYDQYSGYCQICKETITKYDGENYFEAINMLRTTDIYKELLNDLETGWNSLCLCPNCSAMYNYSSKVISGVYSQVISKEVEAGNDEYIEIDIELPEGSPKKIYYSPRHFLALKKAFKIFGEVNK